VAYSFFGTGFFLGLDLLLGDEFILLVVAQLHQQLQQAVRQFWGRLVLLFQALADLFLNLGIEEPAQVIAARFGAMLMRTSHRYGSEIRPRLLR